MASRLDELQIVLVGKTGSGKTSMRDFLLEKPKSGVTTTVCDIMTGECDGQKLVVIDTPGVHNIKMTKGQVKQEIEKCMTHAEPGPHVFLYVAGRFPFTQEDHETMATIEKIFGPKVKDHTLAVFRSGKPSKDSEMVLSQFKGPWYQFNIKDKSSKRSELLKKINELVQENKKNKRECYTNKAFKDAKKSKVKPGSELADTVCEVIKANLPSGCSKGMDEVMNALVPKK